MPRQTKPEPVDLKTLLNSRFVIAALALLAGVLIGALAVHYQQNRDQVNTPVKGFSTSAGMLNGPAGFTVSNGPSGLYVNGQPVKVNANGAGQISVSSGNVMSAMPATVTTGSASASTCSADLKSAFSAQKDADVAYENAIHASAVNSQNDATFADQENARHAQALSAIDAAYQAKLTSFNCQ
jgi:hypothetical protein